MMAAFVKHDVKKLPSKYVEYPYRDYDLIEFLKKISENNEIIAIYFDEESHYISFVAPSIESDTKRIDLDELGITESEVQEFSDSFLKNIDKLAEIDDSVSKHRRRST